MTTAPDLPGAPMVYDNFPGPAADAVAVGEASTDVIPRVWAERILGQLRADHPATWRRLLGLASIAGKT